MGHCTFASLCLALGYLTTESLAQTGQNHFIFPQVPGAIHDYADNKNLTIGSTENLQWSTNYPMISLILWQNDNDSYYTLIDNQPATQSLSWPIDLTGVFSLDNGNIFFFQMWNVTNNGQNITDRFSSHYFNLVAASSTTSATTTISAAVQTASALPSAQTSSIATATSSPSSSGLSTGAKTGIGVGVGIGVAGLLIAGAIIWLATSRKKQKGSAYTQARSESSSAPAHAAPVYQSCSNNAQGWYSNDKSQSYVAPAGMSAGQAAPVEMATMEQTRGPQELDSRREV